MSAFGGKADIAATLLRKPLVAGAPRQLLAQSGSAVCAIEMTRRPKRRSRSLSAARKVRMPSPSRARNVIVKTVIYYNVITLLGFDSYIRN
jgi:hypothetical protein